VGVHLGLLLGVVFAGVFTLQTYKSLKDKVWPVQCPSDEHSCAEPPWCGAGQARSSSAFYVDDVGICRGTIGAGGPETVKEKGQRGDRLTSLARWWVQMYSKTDRC
jgi:hypothetical protein